MISEAEEVALLVPKILLRSCKLLNPNATNLSLAFRLVACLFCKSATAYNPIIYFFMGKEFREDCCFLFAQVVERLTCCKRNGDMRLGFYSEPSSVAPVQARRNMNRQGK